MNINVTDDYSEHGLQGNSFHEIVLHGCQHNALLFCFCFRQVGCTQISLSYH